MQRKTSKQAIVGLLVFGWIGWAATAAAVPTTETFNANAEILTDLALTNPTELDFGKIVAPSAGTELFTVSTSGVMSEGGGDGSAVSGHQAGVLDLNGDAGETVILNTSGTTFPVTCTGGTGTVTLNAISFSNASPTLDTSGVASVNLGGTLEVGSDATSDVFTCAYIVEGDYQ